MLNPTSNTRSMYEYAIPPFQKSRFPDGRFWITRWGILGLSAPEDKVMWPVEV